MWQGQGRDDIAASAEKVQTFTAAHPVPNVTHPEGNRIARVVLLVPGMLRGEQQKAERI